MTKERNGQTPKAFSLVELLIVISIVAVLSVSSVVGFGYLGDILKAREVTAFISDIVKQEELKVLRGDFEQVKIHFYPDYLVTEEEPEGVSLDISVDPSGGPCSTGEGKLDYGQNGNLTQRDENESIIFLKNVGAGTSDCIPFMDSEEVEWGYQVTDGNQFSQKIRFVHFNVNRDNVGNALEITQNANTSVLIERPYGKKIFYDNGGSPVGWLELKVEDESQSTESTLTLR